MLGSIALSAQEEGVVFGVILDGATGDPLAFANVGIAQLGIGSSTELDGSFRLPNIPAGTYELELSYLGYGTKVERITIKAGQELEVNYTLEPKGETLVEVVVSAQLQGQRAAINQQINANTIVNVVSKERLQELPDQNAAESVGRLSGVSVFRDAGEGQRISVRGISPRLNNITINGQRLPSTRQNDRSTDLSMISP
ncbi:MAG: TonB-dependent receptor, partial [Bacteroidetes bacterium]